jgi:predicted polyphosphate/ATP-dependent NAD kinase
MTSVQKEVVADSTYKYLATTSEILVSIVENESTLTGRQFENIEPSVLSDITEENSLFRKLKNKSEA